MHFQRIYWFLDAVSETDHAVAVPRLWFWLA